jgi:signal transduction histidine kinase
MQVLNDVLDLAKIEAGKLDIDPANADIHDFVRRCAALWSPRAHDKGLVFRKTITFPARRSSWSSTPPGPVRSSST